MDIRFSKLQYISQGLTAKEQEYNIQQALDHGVDWVQLRWKMVDDDACIRLAERVKQHCDRYQAMYIVNDRVAVARAVDADGVHLGLQDEAVDQAKRWLGGDKIVGGTANTIDDVLQRINEGCDYIGLGPYRATETKKKLSPILGIEGYRSIIQQLNKQDIVCPPIYAIGGIGPADIPLLLAEGIYGLAISKCITDAPTVVPDLKKSILCAS